MSFNHYSAKLCKNYIKYYVLLIWIQNINIYSKSMYLGYELLVFIINAVINK